MPIATLIKRLTIGRPVLPSEHESNFATIESFVNALESTMATSLNPDGTLTDGAVDTTSKLADAIVTLAKLGDFTNPNAILASNTDDPARPFELIPTGNNQYVRSNATTGALEFGALPANPSLNTLLGVYTGGASLTVPNFDVGTRLMVMSSCLLRGNVYNTSMVATRPIHIAGTKYGSLDWWALGESAAWIGTWGTASDVNALYTRAASSGDSLVEIRPVEYLEGTSAPTPPSGGAAISFSNEKLTVLVFGNS